MKFFTKSETWMLVGIFAFLAVVSYPGFRESLKLARDLQRKNDLWEIYNGLEAYHEDFGVYPISVDGGILACKKPGSEVKFDPKVGFIVDYVPCKWGQDSLRDVTDENKPAYVKNLPADPQESSGLHYQYISDGRFFQIYASLESKRQDEYSSKVEARNIDCGERTCNLGRSSPKTPVDISIEEYEIMIDKTNN